MKDLICNFLLWISYGVDCRNLVIDSARSIIFKNVEI
jgi:hypothetical protein